VFKYLNGVGFILAPLSLWYNKSVRLFFLIQSTIELYISPVSVFITFDFVVRLIHFLEFDIFFLVSSV
jgi:hypothetical protein